MIDPSSDFWSDLEETDLGLLGREISREWRGDGVIPPSGRGMFGSLLVEDEPLRRPVHVPGFIVDLRRLPLLPSADLGVGCL